MGDRRLANLTRELANLRRKCSEIKGGFGEWRSLAGRED